MHINLNLVQAGLAYGNVRHFFWCMICELSHVKSNAPTPLVFFSSIWIEIIKYALNLCLILIMPLLSISTTFLPPIITPSLNCYKQSHHSRARNRFIKIWHPLKVYTFSIFSEYIYFIIFQTHSQICTIISLHYAILLWFFCCSCIIKT